MLKKIYNGPVADLTTKLKPRLEINFFEHAWLDSKEYSIPYYRFLQSILPTIIDITLLFLSLVVSIGFVHIIIAIDIWHNSNLPSPWNRILVVAFVLTIINSVVKGLIGFRKTSVTVKKKKDEFHRKFDDPEGFKELVAEYTKLVRH